MVARVDEDWFDPRSLYADGIPAPMVCALQRFPVIAGKIRECISLTGAKRALEIGPGEVTLLGTVPVDGRVYIDISDAELFGLQGGRVVGDAATLPFKSNTFDVAVMADVLPHVASAARPQALSEAVRVSKRLLVFNQEFGNPRVKGSYVKADEIVFVLKCLGCNVSKIHYDSLYEAEDGRKIPIPLDIICAARAA